MTELAIEDLGNKVMTSFVNSKGELEYNIYEHVDGGVLDLPEKAKIVPRDRLNIMEEFLPDYTDKYRGF